MGRRGQGSPLSRTSTRRRRVRKRLLASAARPVRAIWGRVDCAGECRREKRAAGETTTAVIGLAGVNKLGGVRAKRRRSRRRDASKDQRGCPPSPPPRPGRDPPFFFFFTYFLSQPDLALHRDPPSTAALPGISFLKYTQSAAFLSAAPHTASARLGPPSRSARSTFQ